MLAQYKALAWVFDLPWSPHFVTDCPALRSSRPLLCLSLALADAFSLSSCRFTTILKRWFKSGSFTSFCRQLSYWGWSKIPQKKLDGGLIDFSLALAGSSGGGGASSSSSSASSVKSKASAKKSVGKKKGGASKKGGAGSKGGNADGDDNDEDFPDDGDDNDDKDEDESTVAGDDSSTAAGPTSSSSSSVAIANVFVNPLFVRGRPDLMAQIKRKTNHEFKASDTPFCLLLFAPS